MADWQPSTALGSAVWTAGFSYDPAQDIIYSRMDALQRRLGYAYAYDAAALIGISAVIDCEPIFFDSGGKHWMIELWKGQYGLETGCEVGVYTRTIEPHPSPVYQLLDAALGTRPDREPSHNLFYDCADDNHLLDLSLTLHRNGQPLFSRGPQKHWWLTGFKWGVLSRPEELAVDISIGFPDAGMRQAFESAVRPRGYANLQTSGNTVSFRFERPFSKQPRDTPPGLADQVMRANAGVVDAYRSLGFPTNDPNKVQADFLLLTGLEMLRLSDVYGRLAARLGVEIAKVGDYVVNVLTGFFGVAKQLVEEWFSGALRDLSAWVFSVQSSLGLTMDYSVVVEIDNRAGKSDLLRQSVRVDEGAYGVDPPQWIPKGEVGRFVMHDAKLQPTGSGGSVTYQYCTEDFKARTVTMAYSDPFGFWSSNSASVSGGPFRLQARTTGDWSNSVPAQGHPLYVRYTAVN